MIKVWDPGVRLIHWLLVIAAMVSLWTGFLGPPNQLDAHVIAGTAMAALLVCRLIWGFLGPTYARFSSFLFRPAETLSYAQEVVVGRHPRFIGHNPLGSVMIFALLATIAVLIGTGALAFGGVFKQGPFAFATPYAFGQTSLTFHLFAAYGFAALVCGHLAGVIYGTVVGDSGLVAAMFSGRKTMRAGDRQAAAARARPLAAGGAALLVFSLASYEIVTLLARAALGVPLEPLTTDYVKECGGCHMPYPPSLGTKTRWTALMMSLDEHFGEDASLEPSVRTRILDYLRDNSAEKWDTLAAHELAPPYPEDPLRITATPAWRAIHHGVPEAVFRSKAVRSKSACDACHGDATTGRFEPQEIRIPEASSP